MNTRNREATTLGVLDIRIRHAGGEARLDPNSAVTLLAEGVIGLLNPVEGLESVLSGGPAVEYLSDDMRIPLTRDELAGLIGLELTPDEARRLEAFYGDAFEWHDDFYDQETWEALQPSGLRGREGRSRTSRDAGGGSDTCSRTTGGRG